MAERLSKSANPRFVVTNLDDAAEAIYDAVYTQRGGMEIRIKEQQLHLFADRTCCSKFIANQFRLLHVPAAYVLIEHVRREDPKDAELENAQVETIRLKVLKVAARVVVSVLRVVLHLSGSYPYPSLLQRLVGRLVPN